MQWENLTSDEFALAVASAACASSPVAWLSATAPTCPSAPTISPDTPSPAWPPRRRRRSSSHPSTSGRSTKRAVSPAPSPSNPPCSWSSSRVCWMRLGATVSRRSSCSMPMAATSTSCLSWPNAACGSSSPIRFICTRVSSLPSVSRNGKRCWRPPSTAMPVSVRAACSWPATPSWWIQAISPPTRALPCTACRTCPSITQASGGMPITPSTTPVMPTRPASRKDCACGRSRWMLLPNISRGSKSTRWYRRWRRSFSSARASCAGLSQRVMDHRILVRGDCRAMPQPDLRTQGALSQDEIGFHFCVGIRPTDTRP